MLTTNIINNNNYKHTINIIYHISYYYIIILLLLLLLYYYYIIIILLLLLLYYYYIIIIIIIIYSYIKLLQKHFLRLQQITHLILGRKNLMAYRNRIFREKMTLRNHLFRRMNLNIDTRH